MFFLVHEKVEALNERLESYGSGERSLPTGEFPDYTDSKNPSKHKCKFYRLYFLSIYN